MAEAAPTPEDFNNLLDKLEQTARQLGLRVSSIEVNHADPNTPSEYIMELGFQPSGDSQVQENDLASLWLDCLPRPSRGSAGDGARTIALGPNVG